jgi:hypothetical protein
MKNYKIIGKEVVFAIELENTTTDAVTGSTWSGEAYGTIAYAKATSSNPMYQFEPLHVGVQLAGTGILKSADFTVVQNRNTGFIGVLVGAHSWQAGSKIIVYGYFTKLSTAADAVTGIELNSYTPPDITNSKAAGITIS